jgi:protease I
MAKALMIIAPSGYQDFEYGETRKVLEKKGHEVITSSTVAVAQGALGGETQIDVLFGEIDPQEYDAVIFVGGPGTAIYFQNSVAHKLAREFAESGKITAAICIAPVILANAGLLEGKKSTVFPSGAEDIMRKGALFTDSAIEIDGNIVTANGPKAARKFGKKIAKLL